MKPMSIAFEGQTYRYTFDNECCTVQSKQRLTCTAGVHTVYIYNQSSGEAHPLSLSLQSSSAASMETVGFRMRRRCLWGMHSWWLQYGQCQQCMQAQDEELQTADTVTVRLVSDEPLNMR